MTFSNLVMFAIIVATAETLHAHGKTTVQGAAQAAEALKPFDEAEREDDTGEVTGGCWPFP